jgi:hypothetical protein
MANCKALKHTAGLLSASTKPMKTETKASEDQRELEEAFRIADEVREEVSRMPREEQSDLEASAHGVIRGARSARATSGARY